MRICARAPQRNPKPEHPGFRQNILHLRDYAASVRKSGRLGDAEQLEKRFAAMVEGVDEYIASVRKRGREKDAAWFEAWYELSSSSR